MLDLLKKRQRRETKDPPAPADTPTTLAAGVSCSGRAHVLREWCESPARVLAWRHGDRVRVLGAPVPGTARVLSFDAHRLVALLDDGATWTFDVGDPPRWLPGAPAMEDNVTLIAAGTLCGPGFWLVGGDRTAWVFVPPARRTAVANGPIPGAGRVLAIDVPSGVAVLEGGERWQSLAGVWQRIGRLPEPTGNIPVRALTGFRLSNGRDAAEGETLDLPELEVRRLLGLRLVALEP